MSFVKPPSTVGMPWRLCRAPSSDPFIVPTPHARPNEHGLGSTLMWPPLASSAPYILQSYFLPHTEYFIAHSS